MKFLIFLVLVGALLWLLKGTRRRVEPPPAARPPQAPASPQSMVQCAQCGMHLPQGEALPGRGGVFCGEPHRSAYEQSHPAP